MRNFYDPSPEHIDKLSGPWCASYSGGKDSTAMVTWLEWLRRTKQIIAPRPQLVQSDTMVEYPLLSIISCDMMESLRATGWECAVVEPEISEKLYCRILGRGNTPIHAGSRKMRWCTRSTKIDPMKRWRKANSSGLTLTGVRIGESPMRDGKLLKPRGCAAGGECGLPDPSDDTYAPNINWTLCKVIDWLNGNVDAECRAVLKELRPLMRRLVEIYDVEIGQDGFGWAEPEITSARYGCIGCPAIASEREAPRSVVARNGIDSPLNEIYDVWFEARRRENRLFRAKDGKDGWGPIKIAVRKILFDRVMDIQRRAMVILITPRDEAYIRNCWANKVYPRGWSEADELTQAPDDTLFAGCK